LQPSLGFFAFQRPANRVGNNCRRWDEQRGRFEMTKQKTKKAVVKRMKLTKSGKVKFRHAYTSHLMVRRSSKRKRQLRQKGICKGKIAVNMAELLGGR
jgi:large subunit ribosomal protein L35